MKVFFINPPTTTCLEETKTGSQYIEENIGNKFFPLSKIPFEVMYKLNKIENLEKAIILLGGQAIGHLQEQIFDFCPNINFALIGNSDIQLPRLIERLSLNKQNFKDIDGLIYKKNNNIIKNNLTY